ncbi:hypothetical protein [Streptomyces sp. YIM 98790]|uniref:hypothetical protein n=1 Tax=Streptomyces sp. YIM 98790 TaxID=2689077 RepID=UPI00140B5827|nr:hypothetical protein [Streptomyces sp. YIM 98790]
MTHGSAGTRPVNAHAEQLRRDIEAAFGRPFAELHATAAPGARSDAVQEAALTIYAGLVRAEHGIAAQLQRLRELTSPSRTVELSDASHILACAQRLGQFLAARDAHAAGAAAVLHAAHPPATEGPALPPPRPAKPAAASRAP